MNREEKYNAIGHYIDNWSLSVKLDLGNRELSERKKSDLIAKLKALGNEDDVTRALALVEQSDWTTKSGFDEFDKKYDVLMKELMEEY